MPIVYDLCWSSERTKSELLSTPIVELQIERHQAQPPSRIDLIAADQGEGWSIDTTMEYVTEREEVGCLRILDSGSYKKNSKGRSRSRWITERVQSPKWLLRPRRVEVLRANNQRVSVDTGLRFSSMGRELIIMASSFPLCLEIKITEECDLLRAKTLRDFEPEFELNEVTSRPLGDQ